jgi:predicted MFS family arabinose efflux permease
MSNTLTSPAKKHPRIFYGWWIVLASFIISAFTCGVVFAGFTALFEPIAKHYNWSYAQVSLASSIQALMSVVMMPLMGFLVLKFGPKRLILSGVVLL